MSSALPKVREFLAAHSTMTLATVNANGLPEASSLFYATEDDTLIWVSGQRSRHSINVVATGKAAVTVHNETWNWSEIAGVQLEGDASLIPLGPGREHAWEVYKTKFPFVSEFADEVSRSEFYRLVPRWIRLIDNSVRFGYREEIDMTLPGGGGE
jgi:uncharacterized protein YhbP (UPF0306 family)